MVEIIWLEIKASCMENNSNIIHVECLRFCFMGLIREELYKVVENWNLHKIRPCNAETPPGRPDTLFFLPGEAGATDYIKTRAKVIWR